MVIALLGVSGGTAFAQLVQDHPYQVTLRNYLAQFKEKDFEVELKPLQVKRSYFSSAEDAYRPWLFFGYEQNEFMDSEGLRVDASHFTLENIEANGQVNMTVGKSQFMLAVPTAFFADWDYEGNPHYDSRAVKLRAFVAAAVDMMMQDQEHERGKNDRSDFVGIQLIRWAYPYGVIKDELPKNVRNAYEKGLIKMFERLEDWGPTGIHADMDMGALVGMLYTAKFVESQDLQRRAERHVDMILDKHLYDAGYIDHGAAYDAGYNGISAYFINFAAQLSGYEPLIEAVRKMSRLKAYVTLPDPDGREFSPFHSNPSSGGDAPHDYWGSYNREVGLARYSDDAVYLALSGGDRSVKTLNQMGIDMERMLRFLHHPNVGEFLEKSDKKPGKWKHEHWIDGQSLNATALYMQDDLYRRLHSLQQSNSKLRKPPFSRNDDFTESLGDKMLSVKRQSYGTIIFNDRLSWWTGEGQTETINGFGGGNLSAFWTPTTGTVLLGGTKTAHGGGLDLKDWPIWPVHALSGETSDGRAFSSGIQRHPEANYDLNRIIPRITISGDLTDIYADPTDALQGKVEYNRVFNIKDNGIEITTSVSGDGSNNIKSLYEILPVYLRHGRIQKDERPTEIQFEVNGRWQKAGTSLKEVSRIRLKRFGGEVFIEFENPRQVKLSPENFYQAKNSTEGMNARNIMIKMGDSTKLGNSSVRYFLRSSKDSPNKSWGNSEDSGSKGKGDGSGDDGTSDDGSDDDKEEAPKDRTPPEVKISHLPSKPDDTQRVTFTAIASDDSDIKQLAIVLDGKTVKTCKRINACELQTDPFKPGNYNYSAKAIDNTEQANEAGSGSKSFIVTAAPAENKPPARVKVNLEQDDHFLTAEVQNASDPDGDDLNFVYDWRLNSHSIAEVNIPFDVDFSKESDEASSFHNYTSFQNVVSLKDATHSPRWDDEGRQGGASRFDGKNDFIRVSKDKNKKYRKFRFFSVEAWIKHDGWGEKWASIISKPYEKSSWKRPWVVFKLSRYSDKDNLNFQITAGDKEVHDVKTKQNLPADEWAHIVGTYDGKKLKIYMNGVLDNEVTVNLPLADNPATDIYIGKSTSAGGIPQHYRGLLDEVRVLNVAISAEQVKQHYKMNYNKISLDNTAPGQEWQAAVSANDNYSVSEASATNAVVIKSEDSDSEDAGDDDKDDSGEDEKEQDGKDDSGEDEKDASDVDEKEEDEDKEEAAKDTTPPEVKISHVPSKPDDSQKVTFTADASDDSDIKEISIILNGKTVKTCTGKNTCELQTDPFKPGSYKYSAKAQDNSGSGNSTKTSQKSFRVTPAPVENKPPVKVNVTLKRGDRFLTAEVENVSDPDGDAVNLVFDWRLNSNSIAEVNIPFDVDFSEKSDETKFVDNYSSFQNIVSNKEAAKLPEWDEEGKRGGASLFDGEDDYMRVSKADKNEKRKFRTFSVEAWLKHDGWGDNWASIISKPYSTSSWKSPWVVFKLSRYADKDNLNFQITTGNEEVHDVQTKQNLPSHEWIHIVGTYDGKKLKIYVNGVLDNEQTVNLPLADNPDTDIYIGKSTGAKGISQHYKGHLDEVRVLNVAITPDQVKEHYKLNYHKIALDNAKSGQEWQVAVSASDAKTSSEAVATNAVMLTAEDLPRSDEALVSALVQNFPNPFRSSTTIPYSLEDEQNIEIRIFDSSGRLVDTVYKGSASAGEDSKQFSPTQLSSGVYFYQLVTEKQTITKKMTFLK